MRLRYVFAVAALMTMPIGIVFAAETSKMPEGKAPGPAKCEPRTVAYLGISAMPAGVALERQLGLPRGIGLLVEGISPEGPAAKAGIGPYDVLQKLDDQLLTDLHQLRVLVWMHKPGDTVKVSYFRNGKPETATMTLGSTELKGEECAFYSGHGWLGPGMHGGLWDREMSELRHFFPRMEKYIRDSADRDVKEILGEKSRETTAAPKAHEGQSSMKAEKPAPSAQAKTDVSIVTDKYSVTVESRNGQEFATVRTSDGKDVCRDLPQAKWPTLPEEVRGILNGVQIHMNGGGEQVKVET